MKINMHLSKMTKGAIQYKEVDDNDNEIGPAEGAKIGTLYVRKTTFDDLPAYPSHISVSIEALGE